MKSQKLTDAAKVLSAELSKKKTLEDSEKELLKQLSEEIRTSLESSESNELSKIKNRLLNNVEEAIEVFEGTHPTVASNLEKLADMLNKMGI